MSNHSLYYLLILRVPQIAIDSAIFPEGTSGRQLDVLARKALWKDGMNYMVRGLSSQNKTKPKQNLISTST